MPTKKKPAQKPVKKPAKAPVKKAVAKPVKKAPVKKAPAKKAPVKKVKRKLNPALMKPIQPDAVLAVIVGSKPLPRSAMTKKLWDYIKKNNLQDPKKRTMINADPALKAVFGGKKQVSMFEMTKLVSAHVK
jgi:chromatin remodeling complex protein RSC6